MTTVTTSRGIHCGSCKGYHETVAEVRLCSSTNLKTTEFTAEIQRRERAEDEAAAAAKWLRDEWTTGDEDQLWRDARQDTLAREERAAQDRWDRAWSRKPAQPRNHSVSDPSPSEDSHAGMYRDPSNGDIYKVQKAVHGSGQLYAKLLNPPQDNSAESRFEFVYAPGAIRRIRLSWRMTMEQAKEFGALYGVCCVCAATLTRETSIEAGIGPVCASKV